MIISASRRTDIPSYFARPFMDAVRTGFIEVPHPWNPRITSRVSLRPEDVDGIVFWTRDPRPLVPFLEELEIRGFSYYFQFTLMDNPPFLDPDGPGFRETAAAFRELAERTGPDRLVWRYDPIVLSNRTGPAFHRERFEEISAALAGSTRRVMISLVDFYRAAARRFRALEADGIVVRQPSPEDLAELIPPLASCAERRGMEIWSCAEEVGLASFGVHPGKCVDAGLLSRLTGRPLPSRKDPRQRKTCGCDESRDIGVYGTCRRGCIYCYAQSRGVRF
ncbi:MAG: DUF1848 domain-containing protein [Candidatus Aminicenantes bacterium]|nr:DUF1848 domain-containing protein [Candidatus Aminicenantes bacterium]